MPARIAQNFRWFRRHRAGHTSRELSLGAKGVAERGIVQRIKRLFACRWVQLDFRLCFRFRRHVRRPDPVHRLDPGADGRRRRAKRQGYGYASGTSLRLDAVPRPQRNLYSSRSYLGLNTQPIE
jgi:hypothetical protein